MSSRERTAPGDPPLAFALACSCGAAAAAHGPKPISPTKAAAIARRGGRLLGESAITNRPFAIRQDVPLLFQTPGRCDPCDDRVPPLSTLTDGTPGPVAGFGRFPKSGRRWIKTTRWLTSPPSGRGRRD